jgi:citrate lyase subunit beta/citryl-CoA lyase/(3S)-malyl-CoA thioesterase
MMHLPLRSVLFVPAANDKAMSKVATLAADALILDLEDSAGVAEKAEALKRVVRALEAGGFVAPVVLVRVDPELKTPILQALTRFVGHGLHGYAVPKVGLPVHLHGYEAPVWAMIETAKGVLNLREICTAPGLQGLIAGPNDLRADLRVSATPERTELQLALSHIVLHGRAFGLSVIDGVYNAFRDEEGLRRECENGRAMGFDGKTLIHPAQIAVANAVFAATAAQLDWARAVVAAFAQPENADRGVVSVNGEMVERMHLATAQRWLTATALS